MDPSDPCPDPPPPPGPDNCKTDDVPVKNKINREILYDRDDGGDNGCWSLIASGDSVTSAHFMPQSAVPLPGLLCPGTSERNTGPGNDYVFSWAGAAGTDWDSTAGVFTGDDLFGGGDYYNFARVGFDTTQMLTVTKKDPDSCGTPWDRTLTVPRLAKHTPFGLVLTAAKYEIQDKKRDVAWVTTGGVNDTNWLGARGPGITGADVWWGGVLLPYSACELLRVAALSTEFMRRSSSFTVTPTGRAPLVFRADNPVENGQYMQALLGDGGTCEITVARQRVARFVVPKFNIATSGPTIKGNIASMVTDGLKAGIKRIVWVGYYDMSWAEVDIRGLLQAMIPSERYVNLIMRQGLPERVPMFSAQAQPMVQGFLGQLDSYICAGVDAGAKAAGNVPGTAACTNWQWPGFNGAADMQSTVVGGTPHPSQQGMAKLAKMVMKMLPQ
jgi:hypothetical protein